MVELPAIQTNLPGFLGAPVPGGVSAGRSTVKVAIAYPQNDDAKSIAAFKPSQQMTQNIARMPHEDGFVPQVTTLKHLSESVVAANYASMLGTVSTARMIYEVSGTFSTPYRTPAGVVYPNGRRVYIFDAATGQLFGIAVGGSTATLPDVSKSTHL
jgi:hypothetical protein